MKVIILAAGRGSRMEHLTSLAPKCLLQLGGISLLERQVQAITTGGVSLEDIVIITGYKEEMIQIKGVTKILNDKWESTNILMSLMTASNILAQESCIVCYSDILYESNVIKTLCEDTNDIVVPYFTKFDELWKKRFINPLEDLESFKIKDGYISEIGCNVKSFEEIEGQFMGIVKFTPKGWSIVLETLRKMQKEFIGKLDITSMLNYIIKNEVLVSGIPYDGIWLECDNENDVKVYEKGKMYESSF